MQLIVICKITSHHIKIRSKEVKLPEIKCFLKKKKMIQN